MIGSEDRMDDSLAMLGLLFVLFTLNELKNYLVKNDMESKIFEGNPI